MQYQKELAVLFCLKNENFFFVRNCGIDGISGYSSAEIAQRILKEDFYYLSEHQKQLFSENFSTSKKIIEHSELLVFSIRANQFVNEETRSILHTSVAAQLFHEIKSFQ